MIIPESGFPVLRTLITSGYSLWIYQKLDLLHFGFCQYLGADNIVVKSLCLSVYRHFVLLDTERITG